MDPAAVPKKNQNAAYRVYDGQATVVMPDRAEVKVLNEIGSLVWDSIDGRSTAGQIVETVVGNVVRDYDVAPDEARRDVVAFIEALREHGMVS